MKATHRDANLPARVKRASAPTLAGALRVLGLIDKALALVQ